MAKRLSDQLSDLSVRAKNLETAVTAAQKEGHDKLVSRTAEARASATAAVDKVKQSVKAASDAGSTKWGAMEAKLGADMDALKTRVSEKKRAIDAKIAERDAEDAEDDAGFAIDYAIASIEQARLATFDAISARLDAEAAKAPRKTTAWPRVREKGRMARCWRFIGSLAALGVVACVALPRAQVPAGAPGPIAIAVRTADDGVKLHYLTAGSGDAVILLHGYTQTSRMWRPLIPLLAKKFTVIAPDLPGIGDSEIPAEGLDMKSAAIRVQGLAKALGVSKARVVGHDIGLMVAYAYAAQYPAETEKLVVMDAFLPGVAGWEAVYNHPAIWHFRFNGETPELLVKERERTYFEHYWNNFAADGKHSIPEADREGVRGRLRAPRTHARGLGLLRVVSTGRAGLRAAIPAQADDAGARARRRESQRPVARRPDEARRDRREDGRAQGQRALAHGRAAERDCRRARAISGRAVGVEGCELSTARCGCPAVGLANAVDHASNAIDARRGSRKSERIGRKNRELGPSGCEHEDLVR